MWLSSFCSSDYQQELKPQSLKGIWIYNIKPDRFIASVINLFQNPRAETNKILNMSETYILKMFLQVCSANICKLLVQLNHVLNWEDYTCNLNFRAFFSLWLSCLSWTHCSGRWTGTNHIHTFSILMTLNIRHSLHSNANMAGLLWMFFCQARVS